MRLKEDFSICTIAGNTFIVPMGAAVIDMDKMLDLNEVGAYIVTKLKEKEYSVKEMMEEIMKEYEVNEDVLSKDLDLFCEEAVRFGFLEIE